MSVMHANFVTLGQKLIAKNGRLVTLQKLSGDFHNDGKPWRGAGTPTVESELANVRAAFLPIQGSDLGTYFDDKELFKKCDEVMMIADPGDGTDMKVFHQVADGDKSYHIETIQLLKPGETAILWFYGISR